MMLKLFFRLLLPFLFIYSIPAQARGWALKDTSLGWNSQELVSLYFHNSELQTQWAWEALSHYRFDGSENVLDFGSGDGKLSALMSFMVPQGQVTGIDISKDMVFYATNMFPSYHYQNLAFQASEDIDFSQLYFFKKFDLITSFCVFHLVPNPKIVLQHLKDIMQPDGHLVVTLPIGGNLEFFQAATEEMALRGLDFPAQTNESRQMRNPNKIKEILSEAGFDVTYFKVVDTRFPFSSVEEMVDWFEGTLTANWNVPVGVRREFFTALAKRYLTYRPEDRNDNGFVYFSLKRIDFVATPTSVKQAA